MAPARKSRKPRRGIFKRVLSSVLKGLFVACLLTMVQVLILRFVNPPFTLNMAWNRLKGQWGETPYEPPVHYWRSFQEIDPDLAKAVLAGEDQRFFSHHGFDFVEMDKALRDLAFSGRIRGASTVTMQTARTVFLWPGRSWLRKAAEAYYTILIELFWSKQRILEVYLNMVDWGTGIVGAEAAARKYFNRTSDAVTPAQAAALAAVLPSPHRWSPTRPTAKVRERARRIRKDMRTISLPIRGSLKRP